MEYIGVIDDIGNGLSNMYVTDEPIIRCRDCVYFSYDERVFGDEWIPVNICDRMHDDQGECLIVQPNGFCAWGERRSK